MGRKLFMEIFFPLSDLWITGLMRDDWLCDSSIRFVKDLARFAETSVSITHKAT